MTLTQKVAYEATRFFAFLKEESYRFAATIVLESIFIFPVAYFQINDMKVLFYISLTVAALGSFGLIVHWIITSVNRARKEFEKDMVDMMNILSVIQMYRGEKQYQGNWKRGEWDVIYQNIIKPELIQERETVTRFLDQHLPDLTPRRRDYLLSKFYELSRD